MPSQQITAAQPKAILKAWMPFKSALGVTSVRTAQDYAQARATIEAILHEIGDDESHPLAEVLDYLADKVALYESENASIPNAEPSEVLRLLMEEHNLKQADLVDCAPQSRISEMLNGQRGISKEVAKKLAKRFGVSPAVFL